MSCAEPARRTRRFPLEVRAGRTPDAAALVWRADPEDSLPGSRPPSDQPQALSFRELEDLTRAAAHAARARGIAPGERVALRLPQNAAYPVLILSLLRAGAACVPLSTRLPEAAVPGLLERIGCRKLIVASGPAGEAPGDIEVVAAADLLGPASGGATGKSPSIPRSRRGGEGDVPPFDRDADATIVFTSGSTGVPKAAVHTFENHWASALGSNRNIPLGPGDRWLLSLPLWHVGGLAVLFRCLCAGAAVALPGREEPLAGTILELEVTHLSVVATQLFRLLRDERGREALRRLKAVLLGGGPAPEALVDEAVRIGVPLVSSYGSTESCSQAAATAPGDAPEALRTAGRTLRFREIGIAGDGEILVRGRTLFRGYLEAGAVDPARDEAGWFHSGDLGRFDARGRLVVAGRRDAMFVSGGENIHPEEIERALLGFPGLLGAVVVPAPDAEFGARPVAFLRTAGGAFPDPIALGRFLRRTLPGFKVPARYLPWPDLAEGLKPDRRALAALARSGEGG